MNIDESIVEDWIKTSPLQNTTKKQYRSQLELYLKRYGGLSVQTVVEYLKDGQHNKRIYHRKYAINSFLRYLKSKRMMSLDEFNEYMSEIKGVSYKVMTRKEVETVELKDLEYLIANIRDKRLKLILMIEFDTAARIRSILKLRKQDIRKYQGKNALYMREKGQKTALKIITDQTHNHLHAYVQKSKHEYFLLNTNKVSMILLDNIYYKLWLKLRNESRNILGTEISFHWVRRGAGVYWYNKTGKDIVFVQELLNHESPATTTKYLKIEGEKVREKMKQERRSW